MVDKPTIDRSIKEALGRQNIDQAFKEVNDNFGTHKDEIVSSMSAVEEHGKTNKLLNILQVADMARNLKRDDEVRELAEETRGSRAKVLKHQAGAVASRSRIEGGIKDIKEMLGGDEPRETQTEKLKQVFSKMADSAGQGNNRNEFNANKMLASFASGGSQDIERLVVEIEKSGNQDKRDLLSALNKASNVSQGKSKDIPKDLAEAKEVFKNSPILEKANINVDTKTKWNELFSPILDEDIKERGKAFKNFRTMAQEGRLTKPGKKARSGVDIETVPEKNNEVLVDIYELLEKWYNEYMMNPGGGGGGLGILPGGKNPNRTTITNPTNSPKGGNYPKGGFTPGSVEAKNLIKNGNGVTAQNGNVFPRGSPQANMIETMKGPPKSRFQRALNTTKGFFSKGLGFASKAMPWVTAGLEGYDAYADSGVAIERSEILGPEDEGYLAKGSEGFLGTKALMDDGHNVNKEIAHEVGESGSRFAGGMATAALFSKGGAIAGTAIGGPIGGAIGWAAGGLIGYAAGSETAEVGYGMIKNNMDDDLSAARDSGLYNWEVIGPSILDKSMLAEAPTPQLQAILRHNDLNELDTALVQEELMSRGGTTAINPQGQTLIEQEVNQDLAAAILPTSDAIGNTTETLADATMQEAKTINVSKDDNSIKTTTIEKGEAFLVEGPQTNDNSLSWLNKRNLIATA